jgi:hypothetical protein
MLNYLTYEDMDFKTELERTIDRLENGILSDKETSYLRKLKQSIESIETRGNKTLFRFFGNEPQQIKNFTFIETIIIYGTPFIICIPKSDNNLIITNAYQTGFRRIAYTNAYKHIYTYIKEFNIDKN